MSLIEEIKSTKAMVALITILITYNFLYLKILN